MPTHIVVHDPDRPALRAEPKLFIGQSEIARYCRVTTRTLQRWINIHQFPVCKRPNGLTITSPSLIDAWILARRAEQLKGRAIRKEQEHETRQ